MSAAIGWALGAAAVAVGYVGYGWRGVLLALTLVVFWLLLQFSRALRALRDAAGQPVGRVANAVMFHARLRRGLRLPQVLALAASLGEKLSDEPETYRWQDAAGDAVRVELRAGRVSAWTLQRSAAGAP